MVESVSMQKDRYTLSPDTIKAIEKILSLGGNAKVSTGKSGVTVYDERVKKAYTQS